MIKEVEVKISELDQALSVLNLVKSGSKSDKIARLRAYVKSNGIVDFFMKLLPLERDIVLWHYYHIRIDGSLIYYCQKKYPKFFAQPRYSFSYAELLDSDLFFRHAFMTAVSQQDFKKLMAKEPINPLLCERPKNVLPRVNTIAEIFNLLKLIQNSNMVVRVDESLNKSSFQRLMKHISFTPLYSKSDFQYTDEIISQALVYMCLVNKFIDYNYNNSLIINSERLNNFLSLSGQKQIEYIFHRCDKCIFADLIMKEEQKQIIDSVLKKLVTNTWYDCFSLLEQIKYFRFTGRPYYWDDIHWDNYEGIIFTDYLLQLYVLGIIDIAVTYEDYCNFEIKISHFMITDLGYKVLHQTKDEEITNSDDTIIIQPNFELIIPHSEARFRHELFFSQFLTLLKTDKNVVTFMLDFKGMVKALDCDVDLTLIKKYLVANTKSIPTNVLAKLDEWIVNSNRIIIRTATIVICEDEYLAREVSNYKEVEPLILENVSHAFTIDEDNIRRVKRTIEKNKRLCKIKNT